MSTTDLTPKIILRNPAFSLVHQTVKGIEAAKDSKKVSSGGALTLVEFR